MATCGWIVMMTAMMLPRAIPNLLRIVRAGSSLRTAFVFLGSYLGLWALASIAIALLDRPHEAARRASAGLDSISIFS